MDSHPLPLVPRREDWRRPDGCPLCALPAAGHEQFTTATSELGDLTYLICRRCGLVFQSPRLSHEWLLRYYEVGYHLQMHGQKEPGAKAEWVESRRAEQLMAFVRPHVREVGCHLDIGSSLGKLLTTFADTYHSDSYGVEPARAYRREAKAQGHAVVSRLSELDAARAHGFDLVSLSHVLEHMTAPVETLRRLHRDWMTDGAYLVLEVPNFLAHPSLELAHLAAFTKDTVRRALRVAGFALVSMRCHGKPYSRRIPFYVQALAQRVPAASAHIGPRPSVFWIRVRRELGMLRLRATWALAARVFNRRQRQPWDGGT